MQSFLKAIRAPLAAVSSVLAIAAVTALTLSDFLPVYIAVGLMVASFVWLSVQVFESPTSAQSYFFANFDIDDAQFTTTLAATNIPLVLGLMYFLSLGKTFGIWVIIGLVVCALLPFLLLAGLSQRFNAGVLPINRINLHEFLGYACRRTEIGEAVLVRKVAAGLTIVSFLFAIGFELVFGSQILLGLLGISGVGNVEVAFGLAVLIGAYAMVGGLRGVFQTDAAQFGIVSVGMILLAILVYSSDGVSASGAVGIVTSPKVGGLAVFFLLAGSLVFYPLWYVSTLDTWQRAIATGREESLDWLWQGVGGVLVLGVYFCAGLVGVHSMFADQSIVPQVVEWATVNAFWLRLAGLMAICALVAGLFSTIDTYAVMVSLALFVDLLREDWRLEGNTRERSWRGMTFTAPVIAVALAYGVQELAVADPKSLFYVAYAGQAALGPYILFGLRGLRKSELHGLEAPENTAERSEIKRKLSGVVSRDSTLSVSASERTMAGFIILGYVSSVAVAMVVKSTSSWLYATPLIAFGVSSLPLLRGTIRRQKQ